MENAHVEIPVSNMLFREINPEVPPKPRQFCGLNSTFIPAVILFLMLLDLVLTFLSRGAVAHLFDSV